MGKCHGEKLSDMPELFSNALKNKNIGFILSLLKVVLDIIILKLKIKEGQFVQYEDQWFSRHILLSPSAIRDEEQQK